MNARFIIFVLALLGACAASAAQPTSFTFTVEPPPLTLVQQDDGYVDARLPGWSRLEGAPGFPQLPSKTFLIALPPGATPRLDVRLLGQVQTRTAVPRPIARDVTVGELLPPDRREADLWAKDALELPRVERRDPDPERYAADGAVWPEAVVRLGEIGVVRNQRYVAVHVSPVRWDPAAGQLRVEPALELTVSFDGATSRPAAWSDAGAFEAVYRSTFVNYGQGQSFRLTAEQAERSRRTPAGNRPTASATTPRRRVLVSQDGIVRLDHTLFTAQAPEFLTYAPSTWRLTRDGVDVPLHVVQPGGGDPALLESGEWVQFHGEALDDEPRMELIYDDTAEEDLYAVRDVTDVGVYFLTIGAPAALIERDATPGVGTPEASFRDIARHEVDEIFFPLPADDTFYDLPGLQEALPNNIRTDSVPLPGLLSGTEPLDVRVRVRGSSQCDEYTPDHETRVSLQDAALTTLELPAGPNTIGNENVGLFDGLVAYQHDIAWTHSGGDPEATDPLRVRTEASNIDQPCTTIFGGNVRNDVFLNWIEVDYARAFSTDTDTLAFSFPDQDAEFEITGFDSAQPEVWELTNGAVRLTGVVSTFEVGDGTYTIRFGVDNDLGITDGEPRRFVAFGDAGVATPAASAFPADRESTLISDPTPADMVVIFHPDVVPSQCSVTSGACSYDADCPGGMSDVCEIDPASGLADYVAHRAGGGISVRLARIGDVADEFNGGFPGPDAISGFLGFLAGGGWSGVVPEYVLLLGDASYSAKGGTSTGEYVPTQIVLKVSDILTYYASDTILGAVVGPDFMPEFAIGRIPARTPAEADVMLDKIRLYESAAPAGPWRHGILLVSDRANDYGAFEALEFERINQIGADAVAPEPYDVTFVRYWSDYCGGIPAGCGPAASDAAEIVIKDTIDTPAAGDDDGVALVQFSGHGNFDLWSSDVLMCTDDGLLACDLHDDSEDLDNGLKLPLMMVHNCLTGGFHTPELKSFGEQFVKRDGGGAVAVWAPSGLGFRFIGESVTGEAWDEMFGKTKSRTLASPILRSLTTLCGNGTATGTQACHFYTLLGDPATTLAFPSVAPATSFSAVASTGPTPFVQLDWDDSLTPGAVYSIFRQNGGFGAYFPIAAGLATSDYLDSNVTHLKTYRYYIVAESAGFASAWSNFNSDCDGAQNDCVEATPINEIAPATPVVVEVRDNETGGTVFVDWLGNPEPDIAFYTLHWGLTPDTPMSLPVKIGTSAKLTGIDNGVEVYVAVSATNTSGLTSLLSPAVAVTPSLVLGVRAPGLVTDLRLGRSGSDATLSWTAISLDIYGKPETVATYEIYRGLEPEFVPTGGHKIGQTATTTFVDPLALSGAAPDYHYLVRAIDADGNAGGLGRQLPSGITDLSLSLPSGSSGPVSLSWPAVTTDFDGAATTIVRYEVWGSDTPMTREDIEAQAAGVTLIDGAVTGTSLLVQPGDQKVYYSVLAVDSRGNRSPF